MKQRCKSVTKNEKKKEERWSFIVYFFFLNKILINRNIFFFFPKTIKTCYSTIFFSENLELAFNEDFEKVQHEDPNPKTLKIKLTKSVQIGIQESHGKIRKTHPERFTNRKLRGRC